MSCQPCPKLNSQVVLQTRQPYFEAGNIIFEKLTIFISTVLYLYFRVEKMPAHTTKCKLLTKDGLYMSTIWRQFVQRIEELICTIIITLANIIANISYRPSRSKSRTVLQTSSSIARNRNWPPYNNIYRGHDILSHCRNNSIHLWTTYSRYVCNIELVMVAQISFLVHNWKVVRKSERTNYSFWLR